MISALTDVIKLIEDKNFKKIFILSGKNSFVSSGAESLFKQIKNKEQKFYFKK